MSPIIAAFFIGVVVGLRSLTGPAAVSWAARLGWIHLENTPLAFLGYAVTPWIFTLLAIAELVNDKMPKTPSRKAPPSFIFRVVSGGFCGAAIGEATHSVVAGIVAGALGAVAGTLGGYEFRCRLVRATGGHDLPIAFLEDLIAIAGAFLIVSRIT